MNRILHIFRKDVRHLWVQILVTFALFLAFDIFQIWSSPLNTLETERINSTANILGLLLTLAIWYLVALAVYDEPLPGDRQFWLTRPYSRTKLLAAKIVFILIFINALLFLSDCVILGAQGFPVLRVVPQLFLRQLPLSIFFILPAFAIATLTRGVAQFVLAWFIVLLSLIAQSMIVSMLYGHQGVVAVDVGGIAGTIFLAIIACAVILWQYATRRTTVARVVVIVLAFVSFPVMSAVATWARSVPGFRPSPQPISTGPAGIQIKYEAHQAVNASIGPPPGMIGLQIPVRVEGLPPDTLLQSRDEVTIEVGGKPWPEPTWHPVGSLHRLQGVYWELFNLDSKHFNLVKNQLTTLETRLHLELVTDKVLVSVPVEERSFVVPNFGHCVVGEVATSMEVACRIGLLAPAMAVRIRDELEPTLVYNGNMPAGMSPVSTSMATGGTNLTGNFDFIPRHQLQGFERTISIGDVRLANYAINTGSR